MYIDWQIMEIEISPSWRSMWRNNVFEPPVTSKSTQSTLIWSFVCVWMLKSTWIQLKFHTPCSSSSLVCVWFWHELDKTLVDSCSKLHQHQQSTKKNGVYVENFEVFLWEKIWMKTQILDLESSVLSNAVTIKPLYHLLINLKTWLGQG